MAEVREGSWAGFAQEAPELARDVRAAFGVRKHCTMATLRAGGGPRISGTEVQLDDDELHVGSMAGARKARDLLRDGRLRIGVITATRAGDAKEIYAEVLPAAGEGAGRCTAAATSRTDER